MLFWILVAALTAGVVALLVPPLLRGGPAADTDGGRAAYDLEVYRDQLTELERERTRGVIDDQQMAAARAEIGRRMLSAAQPAAARSAQPLASPAPARAARALALVIIVGLPLGALAVYLPLGRPELPAQPLLARDLMGEQRAAQAEEPQPGPDVLAAVERLKAHLAANPADLEGWTVLGQVYGRMGRWQDATDALGRAADLSQGDPDITAAYGETLTNANGGIVPEAARRVFETAVAKDPKEPRARYYLALARYQGGDVRGALDGWRAIVAETPADAPWLPAVRARIATAARDLGLEVTGVMPAPLPPAAPESQAPESQAPESQDGRDRMIRGMVDSLAQRLKDNPADVDGWIRLARSYRVLGDRARAEEAARRAVAEAPRRIDALLALVDALTPDGADDARGPTAPSLPAEAVAALEQVLAIDPDSREALWRLGLDAANGGRPEAAAGLWSRLLARIPPGDPDHTFLRQRIDALKQGG